MKLRNKKTGKIIKLDIHCIAGKVYENLAELNEEWEDYNELEYWYIDSNGDILFSDLDNDKLWKDLAEERKQIGNYFSSREEAEIATRKLKAWKRLKDKGFRFLSYFDSSVDAGRIYADFPKEKPSGEVHEDLDLLFGGEE